MPAIPSRLMESSIWQHGSLDWANVYALLAPRVNVKGRMALLLLVTVGWAFSWLLWRAYSVIQTPNDVLVDKLGLDIPPPPLVTLEDISARETQISWKPAEASASIQENHIEVNGRLAGVTKKNETAVAIYNLQPDTLYDIRVFSVSVGRFQTPSTLLRVRTRSTVENAAVSIDLQDVAPTVRALASRLPPTPPVTTAPAMAREQSGGPISRRGTNGRRSSPAGHVEAGHADGSGKGADEETDGSLRDLSLQFQRIQQDIEAIEAQIQEEDREYEAAVKDKEFERNELRTQLKERDEISGNLRREVHKAETANRAAQTEKTKKERLLEQKQNQRRKRKDDMAKWEEDTAIMIEEVKTLNTQQALVERKKQSDISQIRQKIEEEQREVAALEEDNKEKALEIKALEEERQLLNEEEETDETREADHLDQEKEVRWRERMNHLQANYAKVLFELQQAHQHHAYVRERLEAFKRAAVYTYQQPNVPIDVDPLRRGVRPLRRNRHASSQGSNISSPRAVFGSVEPYNMNAHFSSTVNASPTTAGSSFFNPQNGMTLMMPSDNADATVDEPETLLSAPMSPRADALLPADLLGDESADEFGHVDGNPSPQVIPRPRGGHDEEASPLTDSHSSPRSFSSPREEFTGNVDWDQVPTESPEKKMNDEDDESPDGRPTALKRPSAMANLFSFNRQRGKTLADQPPLLGSLKSGESQSFPLKYDEFDPSAQPRRRLSYGGNWAFPGSSLLGRGNSTRESERLSASRRGFPGLFSKSSTATQNYDPFAPDSLRGDTSPSRPSSVYSFDRIPRPSGDSQFHAWAMEKGIRNSPLAPHWSSLSRNHSRRPSLGYGSATNLSIGPVGDDDDDGYLQPRREPARPLQAPIGTRPASSQRPSTPKLNPAAPSFTMFFAKSREKAKEKAKAKDKDKDKDTTPKPAEVVDSSSPPESRKSKDTSSIAATTSTYESRDSLERTPSGYSGGTPIETTPSRPTFISKITRKASSNKFGSWKGQGGIFSRKDASTPTGDTEEENNGSLEILGKSYESMATTPIDEKDKKASRTSLGNWNFMRKSKRKDDLSASEVGENADSERASIDITTEEDE